MRYLLAFAVAALVAAVGSVVQPRFRQGSD
jgi:hypothetical protein